MEKPIFDELSLRRRWSNMIQRSTNPNNANWSSYGGRGITVCPEWRSFRKFAYDMGFPPKGLTLDRVDNDKGYYKANCRWASWQVQNSNKRPSIYKELTEPKEQKSVLPKDSYERKQMINKMTSSQLMEKKQWLSQKR